MRFLSAINDRDTSQRPAEFFPLIFAC
jgi:hypothetical protein